MGGMFDDDPDGCGCCNAECRRCWPPIEGVKYEVGDARAVQVGLIELKDGRVIKGALLDFPAGPPPLPFSAVWEGTPLTISVKPKKAK